MQFPEGLENTPFNANFMVCIVFYEEWEPFEKEKFAQTKFALIKELV